MGDKPPENLIVERPLNIIGKYRICDTHDCTKYIQCPYVKCNKHRTDMATKERNNCNGMD
jgi:hypothetical protein